jgi:Hemerythrin HHE cation binding domain
MTPQEARDLILLDHVQIRIAVTGIDRAMHDGEDVTARVRELVRLLWNHLAFEDRLLPRLLREADGWGEVRADRLEREHARQRAELSALLEASHALPWPELVSRARTFITELRADMDAEEAGVLAVLRDDVIAIDQTAG